MKDETIHFELGGTSDALEHGLEVIQEQDILKRLWKHSRQYQNSVAFAKTGRVGNQRQEAGQ